MKNQKWLRIDTDLFDKYNGDQNLSPIERRLVLQLVKCMSNTGQCLYENETLREQIGCSYPAFRKAVNTLIDKQLVGIDVFGRLYLVEIQRDARHAAKILSWSDLMNLLADHTDIKSIEECWNYQGDLNGDGYGQIQVGQHIEYAHRLAFKFFNGKITKRTEVHHTCGNPPCVNPRHLVLVRAGTHKRIHRARQEPLQAERKVSQ